MCPWAGGLTSLSLIFPIGKMGIRQNGAYTVQDDLAHSRCFINVSLLHTHPPGPPPSTLPQQLSSSMLQPYETPKFKSSALISLLNSRLVYPTADLASLLGCLSSIPDLTVPPNQASLPPTSSTNQPPSSQEWRRHSPKWPDPEMRETSCLPHPHNHTITRFYGLLLLHSS